MDTENKELAPCPNCGHCPTCGHTSQKAIQWIPSPWFIPTAPIQPYVSPFWYYDPNGTTISTTNWEVTSC